MDFASRTTITTKTENTKETLKLLITNGKIVNDDGIEDGDIYIENGIIVSIGEDLAAKYKCSKIINAKGKYILPGGVDPHTHFERTVNGTKSVDDFYEGTKAALCGGTTTIIDFVVPTDDESITDAFRECRRKADAKVCCDYGLHVCIPKWNDDIKKEMAALTKNQGVNSFKMFMSDEFRLTDAELYSAFEYCKELGALPMVHCENGEIIKKNIEKLKKENVTKPEGHLLARPEIVEAEAVNRACVIASQVTAPMYIVHVMSREAVDIVDREYQRGAVIYAETIAAALALDGSHYKHSCFTHAAAYVLSPPLSANPDTPNILTKALAEGILQITASDNCTFTKKQKEIGKEDFSKIPDGVNGAEDRMSVVWEKGVTSGMMSPERFVEVTSSNAAKLFNLYPRKGRIAVGSDADIVIWNHTKKRFISAKNHHHACDFNIFEGMKCHGIPEVVIANGYLCYLKGEVWVKKGRGRYLETQPFSPHVYKAEEGKKLCVCKSESKCVDEDN